MQWRSSNNIWVWQKFLGERKELRTKNEASAQKWSVERLCPIDDEERGRNVRGGRGGGEFVSFFDVLDDVKRGKSCEAKLGKWRLRILFPSHWNLERCFFLIIIFETFLSFPSVCLSFYRSLTVHLITDFVSFSLIVICACTLYFYLFLRPLLPMFLSVCLVDVFTISFCVFVFLSVCLRCLICPPFRQITFFSEKMRVSLRGLQTTESFFALNFFSF